MDALISEHVTLYWMEFMNLQTFSDLMGYPQGARCANGARDVDK